MADGIVMSYMRCPSSPLPATGDCSGFQIAMPSYVGIAGAQTGDGFVERRFNDSSGWCCEATAGGAVISGGGVLIPNAAIAIRDITDGTSQTLIVGEISDWAIDRQNQRHHIDGGWPSGWMAGCIAAGTPPKYTGDRAFNITTVRYAPNIRDYGLSGVAANHGPSNPLVSAHASGFYALLADGHVRFIANNIYLLNLKLLATRDDGMVIGDD